MSAAARPESPGCIHTIESGRAYAHGPWCDVLRALEAENQELRASLGPPPEQWRALEARAEKAEVALGNLLGHLEDFHECSHVPHLRAALQRKP